MNLLPWVTLVIALFTFGIWMYIKQVEVVNNPPGPNMWVVLLVLFFFVAIGFVGPFFLDPTEQEMIFLAVVWAGIAGASLTMLIGVARMLTGGPKKG